MDAGLATWLVDVLVCWSGIPSHTLCDLANAPAVNDTYRTRLPEGEPLLENADAARTLSAELQLNMLRGCWRSTGLTVW